MKDELLCLKNENTPMKNCDNNLNESVKEIVMLVEDSMKNIKMMSENKTLNDTTKRNCPKCNKILFYKNKRQLLKAIRNNTICKSCSIKITNPHLYSCLWKTHINDENKSWTKKCPRCNSLQTYKTKRNLNKAIIKNQVCMKCQSIVRRNTSINNPNYNPRACNYFEELNKHHNWNLQHAMNGGEVKCLQYWLDAYDKDKNIVVEYDEPIHYRYSKLRDKDIYRMNEIIQTLKCRFFRYNEKTKVLTEYTNIGH